MKNESPEIRPLTPDNWADFEELFGRHGVYGCWCMWWRIPRSQFTKQTSEENHQAMSDLVSAGQVPGILAYLDGKAVGWCSLAPREEYLALERSRVLKRIDDKPVWSIVCFYIEKKYRRQGVTIHLLKAALDYAREHGAQIVEGYPIDPREGHAADAHVFTGLASAFRQAGFSEARRLSETRLVMRYYL